MEKVLEEVAVDRTATSYKFFIWAYNENFKSRFCRFYVIYMLKILLKFRLKECANAFTPTVYQLTRSVTTLGIATHLRFSRWATVKLRAQLSTFFGNSTLDFLYYFIFDSTLPISPVAVVQSRSPGRVSSRYAYDRYEIYEHVYQRRRSHDDFPETHCLDTHFVYLGKDTFRMKGTDETLKQVATFTRKAIRDTRISVWKQPNGLATVPQWFSPSTRWLLLTRTDTHRYIRFLHLYIYRDKFHCEIVCCFLCMFF